MRHMVFRSIGLLVFVLLLTPRGGHSQSAGTGLTATASTSHVLCVNCERAATTVLVTLTSSGSVSSVLLARSVDGGDAAVVREIEPQDFESSGRNRAVHFADNVALGNGEHTLTYCFFQRGPRSLRRKACSSVTTTVQCTAPPNCGSLPWITVFGLRQNPSKCAGRGSPLLVHVSI